MRCPCCPFAAFSRRICVFQVVRPSYGSAGHSRITRLRLLPVARRQHGEMLQTRHGRYAIDRLRLRPNLSHRSFRLLMKLQSIGFCCPQTSSSSWQAPISAASGRGPLLTSAFSAAFSHLHFSDFCGVLECLCTRCPGDVRESRNTLAYRACSETSS